MLALCGYMFSSPYYAENYTGIIDTSLQSADVLVYHKQYRSARKRVWPYARPLVYPVLLVVLLPDRFFPFSATIKTEKSGLETKLYFNSQAID